MNTPLDILQKYWGYVKFRDTQEDIIASVLKNNNTIALLPTGGGKSICFQIPALLLKGVCIVVSPMISLMRDQVEGLQKKGIKATMIAPGSSQDDIIALFDNLKFGGYKFLYVSPERLSSKLIQEKIKELTVNSIAVDEAHCISEWGHDFRPSYRNICNLRSIHPNAVCIALTATATQNVLTDISENLGIENATIFKKSFYRKELAYQIYHLEDKLTRLVQIFKKTHTPAIVYVRTRKRTQEIASFLMANDFTATFYHGGMTPSEKKLAYDNWMLEKTKIIVATNAFGMGIDKSNVGIVVHLDLPYSIENFVQEAGRAGRDGKRAFSVVLQNNNDIYNIKEQYLSGMPSIQDVKDVYKKLHQFFNISYGELPEKAFQIHVTDFCQRYKFHLSKVQNVLSILANNGILEMNTEFRKRSTLQFIVSSYQLIQYKNQSSTIHKVIDSILRSYTGIFEYDVKIDEFTIAKKAGLTSNEVKSILLKLDKEKIANYHQASNSNEVYFLVPREDDSTINSISKNIQRFLKQQQNKIEQLINFIQNDTVCRSQQLLLYFGETNPGKCTICDVCLKEKYTKDDLSSAIINTLSKHAELSSIEIQAYIEANEEDILIHLRHLLSEDKIAINHFNKYYIK
jgi:ATP-dependent DNA helicase RecQ